MLVGVGVIVLVGVGVRDAVSEGVRVGMRASVGILVDGTLAGELQPTMEISNAKLRIIPKNLALFNLFTPVKMCCFL